MSVPNTILFSAFEPSGDALASRLITELKNRLPNLDILAFGGPRMQAAGATLIEQTTSDAVMLAGAIKHAKTHYDRLKRAAKWLKQNKIDALIPTDSPAANWGMCKNVRKLQPHAKVIHLAGPQLWAWAPWRIRKLRRLSDHVLCLLPFEPDWFSSRGVPATFVGHPLFEEEHASHEIDHTLDLPQTTGTKLAILPGSRASEIDKNWPTMLAAYKQLKQQHPTLSAVVAAADDDRKAAILSHANNTLADDMHLVTGKAGSVLDWADLGLIVSGTATLQAVTHQTPLVSLYNINKMTWKLIGQFLVRSRPLTLPNIISTHLGLGQATPELMPHFGEIPPVTSAVNELITNPDKRDHQIQTFKAICDTFNAKQFSIAAADAFQAITIAS
ncbi:lipid-A-disaccharide synthase [Poriferisphaera sp. WC338]|uniref:lipid-A-disaccharide synthase n=1 Tax=Poriferisphaera sp. WC338 TaxID=3425129 RepID=UPI003D81A3F3